MDSMPSKHRFTVIFALLATFLTLGLGFDSPSLAATGAGAFREVRVTRAYSFNVSKASAPLVPVSTSLNHRVVDAEYSKALDRVVTVSTTPSNALHLIDPRTRGDVAIELPLAPSSVSVSPDGLFAAVGHNGWVTHVDLAQSKVAKTLAISIDVLDVVLAGDGWIYAFPRVDQWQQIHSLNIATGQELLSTGSSIYAGTVGKLHPGGKTIYGANNGLSPSDIERYDIDAGKVSYTRDSPYHGDYAMCGNLWMSEDGLRIFTACGNVFRASDQATEDMTYNGALEGISSLTSLSQSTAAGKVAAVPATSYFSPATAPTDKELLLFGYQYLSLQSSLTLPKIDEGGTAYDSHGRFVFFNGDGTRYSVIVQADASSGALLDYGLYTVGPETPSFSLVASAEAGGAIMPAGDIKAIAGETVTFSIVPDSGYEIADVLVDGASVGKLASYAFTSVGAQHTIVARFSAAAPQAIKGLNHRVLDAEYSKQLDRIVTVSSTPTNRLYLVDPVDGSAVGLDLSITPTSVSVAPDGLHAAVGHNGWISYVDLAPLAINKVLPVNADVFDIVLANDTWVHVFPRVDQWVQIHSVNLKTGDEATSAVASIRAGTYATLHPSGKSMYGADNGLSPSDIEKYDISAGPAAFVRDSPYHGDYAMCGNLWLSEDGLRIFTACGNVFRASEVQAEDMTHNGALAGLASVTSLSQSSTAGVVVAIPSTPYYSPTPPPTDGELWLFDYQYLTLKNKLNIPYMVVGGNPVPSHGKFVFLNADGSRYSAIVQADASANAVLDYGVYTVATSAPVFKVDATAGTGGTISPSGALAYVGDTSPQFSIKPSTGYTVADVVVDGVSQGAIPAYTFNNLAANHTIAASFRPVTQHYIVSWASAGGTVTPSGSVPVDDGGTVTFNFLPDAGYSVAEVLVDGINVGAVSAYTFSAVIADHSLEVRFSNGSGGGNSGDFSGFGKFGLDIGSYREFGDPNFPRMGYRREKVLSSDASFTNPTVIVASEDSSGTERGRDWYQMTTDGVGLIKTQTADRVPVEFSEPLVIYKADMVPGQSWSSSAVVAYGGYGLDVDLKASVGKTRIMRTPAGFFSAIQLSYRLTFTQSALGFHRTQKWTEWFVPGIGSIKNSGSRLSLSAFGVNGGTLSVPPPVIARASVNKGNLIVTGYQFGTVQDGRSLSIDGTTIDHIVSWSDRKIVATLPEGVVLGGNVVVSTPQWPSNGFVLTLRRR